VEEAQVDRRSPYGAQGPKIDLADDRGRSGGGRLSPAHPVALYPLNRDVEDADPLGFAYGMNAFLRREKHSPLKIIRRKFEFDETSDGTARQP